MHRDSLFADLWLRAGDKNAAKLDNTSHITPRFFNPEIDEKYVCSAPNFGLLNNFSNSITAFTVQIENFLDDSIFESKNSLESRDFELRGKKIKKVLEQINFYDLAIHALGYDLEKFLAEKISLAWSEETKIFTDVLEERKNHSKPFILVAKAQDQDVYGNPTPIFLEELFYDFLEKTLFKRYSNSFILHSQHGIFDPKMAIPFCIQYTEKWFADFTPSEEIPLDGIEFEHWCATQLRKQGWVAQVSKASGDQGSDIIASKNDVTISIQCKRSSKPVGNKAVQEVVASKVHLGTDFACVIATGGFTKSASALSKSTGTALIIAEDITYFEDYLRR